jgi:hypothetical protein
MSNSVKPCIACGNDVIEGYFICTSCNTHQKPSVRTIRKVITWFSGVSIVVGALTIIASLYPQAKKAIFYTESIELVSVNATMSFAPGTLSLANTGDGDVYVSTLSLSVANSPLPYRVNLSVQKAVKKNEMASVQFASKKALSSKYIKTVNLEELSHWIKSRPPEEVDRLASKCFLLKPYDKKKGSYLIDRKVQGVPVVADIEFYSLAKKQVVTKRSETELEGLLFLNRSAACSPKT